MPTLCSATGRMGSIFRAAPPSIWMNMWACLQRMRVPTMPTCTRTCSSMSALPCRTHLPNGMAADLAAEGQQYDAAIKAAGGIDLQLLGLGENGHIGFNEPLSSLVSRTRPVVLAPETRQQNAGLFDGNPESVPPLALTMGTGTILESRRIVLTVAGKAKAEMLRAVLEGPVTAQISASALHFHTNCLVLADEDAASALTIRPALDHALKHDPELCALHSLLT